MFEELEHASDHYQVLGLNRNCSDSEVRRRFHDLSREVHPDRNSDHRATQAFQRINTAYQELRDQNKRNQYNSNIDSTAKLNDFMRTNSAPSFHSYYYSKPSKHVKRPYLWKILAYLILIFIILSFFNMNSARTAPIGDDSIIKEIYFGFSNDIDDPTFFSTKTHQRFFCRKEWFVSFQGNTHEASNMRKRLETLADVKFCKQKQKDCELEMKYNDTSHPSCAEYEKCI